MAKYIDSDFFRGVLNRMVEHLEAVDATRDAETIKSVIRFLKVMEEFHAVDVVHGRWTRKPIGKYTGVDEVCCSICGYFVGVVASDTGFREAIEGMNYCPNCGADMRGDSNNST